MSERKPLPEVLQKAVESTPGVTPTSKIKLADVPVVVFGFIGIRVTKCTVYNWAKKGVKDYVGTNNKLKSYLIANKLYTTKADVKIFLEKVDSGCNYDNTK